jgi:uncharacterized protein YjbI with pentapeptide repeats
MLISIIESGSEKILHSLDCEDNTHKKTIEDAVIKGVSLKNANLCNMDLEGASLAGARLDWANFEGSNLKNANLSRSSIFCTKFHKATITGISIVHVNVFDADWGGAKL